MFNTNNITYFDSWAVGKNQLIAFFFDFGNDVKTFQLVENNIAPADTAYGRIDQLPREIRQRIGID